MRRARRRPNSPVLAGFLGMALLLASCSGSSPTATTGAVLGSTDGPVGVVTTTGILADLVRNVGGDAVQARALVPSGGEVHAFRLSPSDTRAISEAVLLVSNGGGLDDWLDPALDNVSRGSLHIAASAGLQPQAFEGGHAGEEQASRDEGDPHFWHDPLKLIRYVENIRGALIQVDLANAGEYRENANAYISALREMDREVVGRLAPIPPDRRVLISFHDAFGYFGHRYGFDVRFLAGVEGENVSPRSVAGVVGEIREEGIPAVFAEPQFNEDVLRQVAADTGVAIGLIYSGSLDDRVPTYLDMMRFNADSIAERLG